MISGSPTPQAPQISSSHPHIASPTAYSLRYSHLAGDTIAQSSYFTGRVNGPSEAVNRGKHVLIWRRQELVRVFSGAGEPRITKIRPPGRRNGPCARGCRGSGSGATGRERRDLPSARRQPVLATRRSDFRDPRLPRTAGNLNQLLPSPYRLPDGIFTARFSPCR